MRAWTSGGPSAHNGATRSYTRSCHRPPHTAFRAALYPPGTCPSLPLDTTRDSSTPCGVHRCILTCRCPRFGELPGRKGGGQAAWGGVQRRRDALDDARPLVPLPDQGARFRVGGALALHDGDVGHRLEGEVVGVRVHLEPLGVVGDSQRRGTAQRPPLQRALLAAGRRGPAVSSRCVMCGGQASPRTVC